MAMVGGHNAANNADLQVVADAIKDAVVSHAGENNQADFTKWEVVEGTQQVVAGMNYTIKIKVGDDRHVTIKVYRSLPPISYELKSVEY